MATIDIALPDELMAALAPPLCIDLALPKPGKLEVKLPIGVSLQGVADFTQGLPTDCKMGFSLLLQLAPIMASMECLLKVLKFLKIALGIVKNLTPLNIVTIVGQIIEAAADLATCLEILIPGLPLLCFIKGLMELIASILLCAVDALESILAILSGLQLQISAAMAAGNDELLASLNCAQENAMTAAEGTMQSLEPIIVLLSLAQPFLDLAQIQVSISIPSAVPSNDLAAMQSMLQALHTVAADIKAIADAIPC